jgi:peptidoglycan hydrolase-like protein with peptidoglycan-binding domain
VLSALPAAAQQAPPPLAYVQPLPSAAVLSVQQKLRQAGAYNGQIDGVWGADSEAALQRFQQTNQLQVTSQLNQVTAATLGLDPNALIATPTDRLMPASVRTLQARLGALGFYSGPVDGVWGGGTQAAIEGFQRARGLQPDGRLGPATVTAMGLTPEALAYR